MIVVCGEALMDVFAGMPSDGGIACRAVAGGSPFNVAVGLARLGRPTAFLGGLSTDPMGRHLHDALHRAGVDLRWVHDRSERTTLSLVTTDASGHPAYAFYGEGGADRAITPSDLPPDLGDASCLAVGSYSLAVEPIATSIETLVAREAARMAISIDPNLRPRVIGDVDAWRPRFHRLVEHATIVKTSVEDLDHLFGPATDADAIAAQWLARGVSLVVVTRGPDGAVAWHACGRFERPARPVAVVDTVGAGDSAHAALLAYLDASGRLSRAGVAGLTGVDVDAALDAAITAASLTCGRRGADPPDAAELAAARASSPP
jgi:fructokinase